MCQICKQLKCPSECPNYIEHIHYKKCRYCGCEILTGDEYIETYTGNVYHYFCFGQLSTSEILKETDLIVETAEYEDWGNEY